MKKDSKGLADTQEGEFILNESGTTVSTDPVEGVDIPASKELSDKKDEKQTGTELEQEKKDN